MSTPEVRRSPDGYLIAVMTTAGWAVCSAPLGMLVDEDKVAGWTPLLPVSTPDRVTCPWCKKPDRKLAAAGALRKHGKPNTFPPQDCEGSGRTLENFEYMQELKRQHDADDAAGVS